MQSRMLIQALSVCASFTIAAAGLSASAVAQEEEYPKQVVRIVVPFAPGGSTDIMGRIVGEKLTDAFKRSVIVENRGGAGGNLGAAAVAKAAPDGHTLLFTAVSTLAISRSLYGNLPYDVKKDLEPVAVVGSLPFVLLVSNSVQANSVAELLELARATPGRINFGSAGVGTTAHFSGELFKSMAKIDIVHVPYKGNAPALADLLGDRLHMMFDFLPSALPLIRDKRVRALAVTSPSRSPAIPEVPTVAEAGIHGYEVLSYFGVMAPAGTPKSVIHRVNAALNRIAALPETKERYDREGVVPAAESVDWFRSYLDAEIAKWDKVVQQAGLRVN
jgi:tripartite-type tricarboxylate transporter receptor subunit TctC